ncbi:Hypothetical predicted protein [Paramuricea clavata]|uniref:Phosphorylase b kinase regulatory subunit n=1 Tax=Paramuricea clavata TaxID=317549 RepID=A0A7D9J6K5_PARCT|nr:Hypothetical predicted protein [Paramuricea clavata]
MHRVPTGFYSMVWKILGRSDSGFELSRSSLPKFPTMDEMTEGEKNFALKVEEFLSSVPKPEYRQLLVELLMVIATVLERNKELKFHVTIKLDELVNGAMELFAGETGKEQSTFYSTPASGAFGTTTFFARTIVNQLLKESVNVEVDAECVIS